MIRTRRRAFAAAALCALLAVLLIGVGGCFNPFDPRIAATAGSSEPPPVPNSPQGVLKLFRWCWVNRSIAEYRDIFTDDYRFVFSARDSAGNTYRDRPWLREDELISADHLFVGGTATEPPASNITLDYTTSLIAYADSRPGKNPRWHKEIRTEVLLRVSRGESGFEVKGPALFFLVRGDSALIPKEMEARGFQPDSNRWYIQRWEDETIEQGTSVMPAPSFDRLRAARITPDAPREAMRAAPAADAPRPGPAAITFDTRNVTWGFLKQLYRP